MAALNVEDAAHVIIDIPAYAAAGAVNITGVPAPVMEAATHDAAAAANTNGMPAQVNTAEETQDTAAGAVNSNDGKLAWKVAALAQCTVAIAAVINLPGEAAPSDSGELAYLLGLGSVFASGAVEILAALRVSRDAHTSSGSAGRWNLCASFATLILGLSLDVVAVMLNK